MEEKCSLPICENNDTIKENFREIYNKKCV